MPELAQYTVTDPLAPRRAVAENILMLAEQLAERAAADTPVRTGRMRASYRVEQESADPATRAVTNDAPYARYVEYGTRYMRADAPLGRAMASVRP